MKQLIAAPAGWQAAFALNGIAIAILWLMTIKPGLIWSLAAFWASRSWVVWPHAHAVDRRFDRRTTLDWGHEDRTAIFTPYG